MRVLIAFAAPCMVAAYMPFQVPAELFSDVNKGSQPVINIIADRASFLERAPALIGLESKLKAIHPAEGSPFIKATLADALQAAAVAENLPFSDVVCAKDYSGCPTGWSKAGDSCLAPASYAGACPKSVSFAGLTPAERANLAASCDTSYPCY